MHLQQVQQQGQLAKEVNLLKIAPFAHPASSCTCKSKLCITLMHALAAVIPQLVLANCDCFATLADPTKPTAANVLR